jgi:hypothetical protein
MHLKIYSMDTLIGSFKVKADVYRNRLLLVLKGCLVEKELRMVADKIIEESSKLSAGFDIINDISDFKPASESGVKIIYETQDYLIRKGAGRVVRIVNPEPKCMLSFEQFEKGSRKIGYQTYKAESYQEAEFVLKKKGIEKLVKDLS